MQARMTTEVDQIDYIKFARAAAERGMTVQQALRVIARSGVAFFLAQKVGATEK